MHSPVSHSAADIFCTPLSSIRPRSIRPDSVHLLRGRSVRSGPDQPPGIPVSLFAIPINRSRFRFSTPRLREGYCVMLLTSWYIVSAALMTFEFDS